METLTPGRSRGIFRLMFPEVAHLSVTGLHGHQQFEVNFRSGLNIFHGRNGSGKTTMLHILANLFERDIERFCHIPFQTIKLRTARAETIELHQSADGASIEVLLDGMPGGTLHREQPTPPSLSVALRDRLGGRPVYLPAFRSVLEAITRNPYVGHTPQDEEQKREMMRIAEMLSQEFRQEHKGRAYFRKGVDAIAYKTHLCRRWFSPFVSLVRYPSLWEVSDELSNEIQEAHFELSATDQRALTSVFVQVLEAILADESETSNEQNDSQLLAAVNSHLESLDPGNTGVAEIYAQLSVLLSQRSNISSFASSEAKVRGILRVYEKALAARAASQQKAFERLKTFQDSVNRFLAEEGRRLVLDLDMHSMRDVRPKRSPKAWIQLPGGRRGSFSALSSGERHVITLLFAATHMSSSDGVVLIDEPELSLHVEWQRIILTELMKQAGGRQVIACTHAPEVAAEHLDVYYQLQTEPWEPALTVCSDLNETDEADEV